MSHEYDNYSKYITTAILIVLIVLSFLIIKPFLIAIISAAVLAYIFFPFFLLIKKFVKNDTASSFIACFIIASVILVGGFFFLKVLVEESREIFLKVDIGKAGPRELQEIINSPYIKTAISKATATIVERGSEFLINLPLFIINVIVMFFVIFYLFKHPNFGRRIIESISLHEKYERALYDEIKKISALLIYGVVVVGIIQGIIGGVGFWIFGVENPFFWTTVMIVASILPLGAWLVWLPMAIVKLVSADYVAGIGLLLYGVFIISLSDNLLRPMIVGKKTNMQPMLVLIGGLGGIPILGPLGIVLGPIILAYTINFLSIYKKEMSAHSDR